MGRPFLEDYMNCSFLITDQSNTAANALYCKCGGEVSCDSSGKDTVYMFFL